MSRRGSQQAHAVTDVHFVRVLDADVQVFDVSSVSGRVLLANPADPGLLSRLAYDEELWRALGLAPRGTQATRECGVVSSAAHGEWHIVACEGADPEHLARAATVVSYQCTWDESELVDVFVDQRHYRVAARYDGAHWLTTLR